ncbi:MAG: hypothetical protein ACT443_00705 [Gemmatimonadota bacterium]
MRRFLALSAALLSITCGGQTTADPCTIRVNVLAVETAFVGNLRTVEADVTIRSGTCGAAETELAWESKSADVAEIVSFTDSSAVVRAKKVGSSTIVAWLVRTPTVRDSVGFSVVSLVDTAAAVVSIPAR